MELLLEQETAADTLVNLNQPVQQPDQHSLPPEVESHPDHCQTEYSVLHR